MICTFNAEQKEFSSLITLGKNVCGHPTIVHGGLTAAIVDETLGGLNYLMKKRGMLDPGPAFTVHMTMDWKKVWHLVSHSQIITFCFTVGSSGAASVNQLPG